MRTAPVCPRRPDSGPRCRGPGTGDANSKKRTRPPSERGAAVGQASRGKNFCPSARPCRGHARLSPKGEGGSVRGTAAFGRRRQCPEPRSQLSPAVGRALRLRGKRGRRRGCRGPGQTHDRTRLPQRPASRETARGRLAALPGAREDLGSGGRGRRLPLGLLPAPSQRWAGSARVGRRPRPRTRCPRVCSPRADGTVWGVTLPPALSAEAARASTRQVPNSN